LENVTHSPLLIVTAQCGFADPGDLFHRDRMGAEPELPQLYFERRIAGYRM